MYKFFRIILLLISVEDVCAETGVRFRYWENVKFKSTDMGYRDEPVKSLERCMDLCFFISDCTSFNFHKSEKTCRLQTGYHCGKDEKCQVSYTKKPDYIGGLRCVENQAFEVKEPGQKFNISTYNRKYSLYSIVYTI